MSFYKFQTDGFLFTQTGVTINLLKGDYGDGYRPPAAVIGDPAGLRSWTVKIDVLPDSTAQVPLVEGQTRSEYLWDFFLQSKNGGDLPFWIQDPKDDLFYLAEFVDDNLDYGILCSKAYSTGLSLRQRRVVGEPSPVAAPLITPAGLVADVDPATGNVDLSFTGSAGADGYKIERKDSGSFAQIASVGTTTYTDSTVTLGVTYTYRVRAFRGSTYTSYSNEASATPNTFADYLAQFDGGTLRIYAGSPPSVGGLICTIHLPASAFTLVSSSHGVKNGTWEDVAVINALGGISGTPTAGCFLMEDPSGATSLAGTVSAPGGGGDLILDHVDIAIDEPVVVTAFDIEDV